VSLHLSGASGGVGDTDASIGIGNNKYKLDFDLKLPLDLFKLRFIFIFLMVLILILKMDTKWKEIGSQSRYFRVSQRKARFLDLDPTPLNQLAVG
jgi:hypothetical protein